MQLRYTRHDHHLSQVTTLAYSDDTGWTIEVRRESALVVPPRAIPERIANMLTQYAIRDKGAETTGFYLVPRHVKR
jgi:hypothetical protein